MANQTVYPYGTGGSLPSSIGIVNDLTTGGADKALAAEQGKLIGEYLGDGTDVYTTACRYNSSGTRAAREYYYTTGSKSYSNGTFTVTAGNGYFAANQTYRLIYVY